jgi:protein-tyrosine-phosphatase
MKILFICKYNAFRSRIAEEYFNKINKNKKIKSISRGFIYGGDADIEQQDLAKELLGVNIVKRNPLKLTLDDLRTSDLVIIVANDIPKKMFNYKLGIFIKKMEFWGIKDEQYKNKKNIKKIILKINKKVDKLNIKLEKQK